MSPPSASNPGHRHAEMTTHTRGNTPLALLGAAIVLVVVTALVASFVARGRTIDQLLWLVPLAVIGLMVMGWQFHEIELGRVRRQRRTLREALAAAIDERDALADELAQARAELRRLARIDETTGLGNRDAFDQALDEEWRRAARQHAPLAIVFAEVDGLAGYTAALGEEPTRAMLQAVAATVRSTARRAGDVSACFDDHQFAVLFAHTDRDVATELARRLRAAVAQLHLPHPANRGARYVTLSVGVAAGAPTLQDAPAELCADARDALHVARATGGNRVETMWRQARPA